jgi:hypothetical protein
MGACNTGLDTRSDLDPAPAPVAEYEIKKRGSDIWVFIHRSHYDCDSDGFSAELSETGDR